MILVSKVSHPIVAKNSNLIPLKVEEEFVFSFFYTWRGNKVIGSGIIVFRKYEFVLNF